MGDNLGEAASPPATPSGQAPQIEMRLRVDLAMLNLLREFICSVARHLGFDEDHVGQIEICVDEACANAVEHGYAKSHDTAQVAQEQQTLLVEVAYGSDELTVRVIDFGKGTEADAERKMQTIEQYIDETREKYRGLGFHLMHKFMDRVEVRTTPGQGTTVEMTKLRRSW